MIVGNLTKEILLLSDDLKVALLMNLNQHNDNY